MGEGTLFVLLIVLAVPSAVAIILFRDPLKSILAAFVNLLSIAGLFLLLKAPLIALLQFTIVSLLFLGSVQLMRGIGPEKLKTTRRFSFGQLLGLILSFLLSLFVLFSISVDMKEVTTLKAESLVHQSAPLMLGFSSSGVVGLVVSALVLFSGIVGFCLLMGFGMRRPLR